MRSFWLMYAAMWRATVPPKVPETTPMRINTGAETLLSRKVTDAVFSSRRAKSTFSW